MINKAVEFEKGCYCEEYPWGILPDSVQDAYYCRQTRCQHAVDVAPDEKGRSMVLVPFLVTASNQAGHDGTAVCLECILERARELGIRPELWRQP